MPADWLVMAMVGLPVGTLVLLIWRVMARRGTRSRPSVAFREVFLAMNEPALVVAPDGNVLAANPAAAQLVGSRHCPGATLLSLAPQLEVARRAAEGRQSLHALAGDLTGFSVSVGHLRDRRGRRQGSVLVVLDERRDREQVQRLQQDSFRDPLTGIGNRRGFEALVAAALKSRGGGAVGLAFIDLDGFKAINDTLGHAAGDTVLITVARRLEAMLREGDTVARIGGDEFALLLPGITPEGLGGIPSRVVRQLAKPIEAEATRITVGASIGLASAPRDGTTVDALLEASDQRMYRQKNAKEVRDPTVTAVQPPAPV